MALAKIPGPGMLEGPVIGLVEAGKSLPKSWPDSDFLRAFVLAKDPVGRKHVWVDQHEGGRHLRGLSRLYRIMITESAHLIWRLRYERHIDREDSQNPSHTREAVSRRWMVALNLRLQLDCEMTKKKYGRRSLSTHLVQSTWSDTLRDEHKLPPEWAKNGFLVGMGPLD